MSDGPIFSHFSHFFCLLLALGVVNDDRTVRLPLGTLSLDSIIIGLHQPLGNSLDCVGFEFY